MCKHCTIYSWFSSFFFSSSSFTFFAVVRSLDICSFEKLQRIIAVLWLLDFCFLHSQNLAPNKFHTFSMFVSIIFPQSIAKVMKNDIERPYRSNEPPLSPPIDLNSHECRTYRAIALSIQNPARTKHIRQSNWIQRKFHLHNKKKKKKKCAIVFFFLVSDATRIVGLEPMHLTFLNIPFSKAKSNSNCIPYKEKRMPLLQNAQPELCQTVCDPKSVGNRFKQIFNTDPYHEPMFFLSGFQAKNPFWMHEGNKNIKIK